MVTPDKSLGSDSISIDEWLTEQEHDSLCKTTRRNAENGAASCFFVRECNLLMRKAILDGPDQIMVPKSLRPKILALSHNPAVSGHPGGKRMYLTM